MYLAGGTRALLLLAFVLCQRAGRVDGKNDNYQMTDICKKYFLRDLYRKIDGAVLTSQNERDLNCAITFQTHSILQRFMLRFDQLHLDCNDHLYIYDGAHAVGSYKPPSDRSINDATRTQKAKVFTRRSIMTRRVSLVQIYAYVTFLVTIVATDQELCDKKCPGPLKYYDILGCKPVYEKEGDCCATKYDCEHLQKRSTDKCYVNGKEYGLGEALKDEDANPCDVACVCLMGHNEVATFTCAIVDCFDSVAHPGCFRRNSPLQCCPGESVCPDKPEDRATCVVNGKTYLEGDHFTVEDEPDMHCVCQPGYEGKNIEPFCAKPKHPYCHPEFRNAGDIHNKCAPVYENNQLPQTSCHYNTRCQNTNDTVVHNHDHLKSGEEPDEENMCLFGDLKMHIGDELNQATDYTSVCVKCVCEVPPVPTCQRLPDNECDITNHPPFERYSF